MINVFVEDPFFWSFKAMFNCIAKHFQVDISKIGVKLQVIIDINGR